MESTLAGTTVLDDLLQEELAALATYTQVLNGANDGPKTAVLQKIAGEHMHAALQLRKHLVQIGGDPATRSGRFRASVMTEALRDQTESIVMREKEIRGLKRLEKALFHDEIAPEVRLLIRFTLIPQQLEHIADVDRMIAAADSHQ